MAREIGWSQESNLLYQIKQLLSRASGGGSSTPTVQTYATYSAFPAVGTAGVFYVNADLGAQYVWDGSRYVVLQQVVATSIPTITTNGVVFAQTRFNPVFPSTYLSRIYRNNLTGKTYPNLSTGYKCFSNFPQLQTYECYYVSNITVSGIEMIYTNIDYGEQAPINLPIPYISFPDLKYIMSYFSFPTVVPWELIQFPELVFVEMDFTIVNNPSATDSILSLPKLENIGGALTIDMPIVPVVQFPELLFIGGGGLQISSSSTLASDIISINFPKLKSVSNGIVANCAVNQLTSITFGALEYIGGIQISQGASSLTQFSFPTTLKSAGLIYISSASLNQASVDNILIRLAALDGTNGTVLYENSTIYLAEGTSATPSAAGLTAKATLQARGCTVTTN